MSECDKEHEHYDCESCGECLTDGGECTDGCRCDACLEARRTPWTDLD